MQGVIGVHCERVTRTQCGKWLDPVHPEGPGYSYPPGEQVFVDLIPSSLGLSFSQRQLVPLLPRPLSTSPSWLLLTQMVCFREAHFHYSCLKSSLSFRLSVRWLLCVLPFHLPRENLIGLSKDQSHCLVRTVCPRSPLGVMASLWTCPSWVTWSVLTQSHFVGSRFGGSCATSAPGIVSVTFLSRTSVLFLKWPQVQ